MMEPSTYQQNKYLKILVIKWRRTMTYITFFSHETLHYLTSFPGIVLTPISILSIILLRCRPLLKEDEKAILGGIASGFIFYLFIDIFPKAIFKFECAQRLASEVSKIETARDALLSSLQSEGNAAGWKIYTGEGDNKFFSVLSTVNAKHIPLTNAMKRVHSVTPSTPIKIVYSDLGEVLQGEQEHLDRRLREMLKIASIYNISSIDPSLTELIYQLNESNLINVPNAIHKLSHIKNTAALYGTNFDIKYKKLDEIRAHLLERWHIRNKI